MDIATHTLQFYKQETGPTFTNLADLLGSVLLLFEGKLASAHIAVQLEKEGGLT